MIKFAALISIFLIVFVGRSQDVSLPADLRQHTLTQYNSSLFNPTFALGRNNPESIAFWTRWQWQNIDTDPTTLFLNYTRSLDDRSAAGIGFFQNNTGIYFNTGGAINYAYSIEFNPLVKLSVGANLFGFVQQLADDRFQIDPIPGLPQQQSTDDFILQLAPGINLEVENFSFSLASENLFDYNFGDKESNTATSDKIFMGMVSYDFPVIASDSTAYIRPSLYLRTIPEQENQIGINALLSTQKYWGQVGYNNFYGISVGAGGTVLNRLSLGALIEFGTSASLNSKDASFEIVASYFLGKPEERRKPVVNILDSDEVVLLGQESTDEKMRKELKKAEALANGKEVEEKEDVEKQLDEKITQEKETKKLNKKEAKILAAQEKTLAKERRKDSIATVKKEKEALAAQDKLDKEEAKLAAKEVKKEAAIADAEKLKEQQRIDDLEKEKDVEAVAKAKELEQQRKLDLVNDAKKEEAVAAAAQKEKAQRRIDSISTVKEAVKVLAEKKALEKEKLAKEEKLAQEETKVTVKPKAGEKYEEVATEDGLEPGFYLIANVFGTKKYFDAFMKDLNSRGINPSSFLRSKNNYNYAYLKRYNTMSEARKARDSKFNGKYSGKTWIFRVVSK